MTPSGEFAVVNHQIRMLGLDAGGDGESVVVVVSTPLGEGSVMVFEAAARVGPGDPDARDANTRAQSTNKWSRL